MLFWFFFFNIVFCLIFKWVDTGYTNNDHNPQRYLNSSFFYFLYLIYFMMGCQVNKIWKGSLSLDLLIAWFINHRKNCYFNQISFTLYLCQFMLIIFQFNYFITTNIFYLFFWHYIDCNFENRIKILFNIICFV